MGGKLGNLTENQGPVTACKAVYAGSIPTLASRSLQFGVLTKLTPQRKTLEFPRNLHTSAMDGLSPGSTAGGIRKGYRRFSWF